MSVRIFVDIGSVKIQRDLLSCTRKTIVFMSPIIVEHPIYWLWFDQRAVIIVGRSKSVN